MVQLITRYAKSLVACCALLLVLPRLGYGEAVKTTPLRDTIAAKYCSYIGIKEATGRNDGKQVNAFQVATGNKTGDAWCASFVAYCLKSVGIKITGNGAARSWFDNRHTVWRLSEHGAKRFHELAAYRANTGGLYFAKLGRIAHIFFIHNLKDDKVITVEGNTSNQLSREGNGCFQCIRKIKQIHSVSNWIDK